MNKIFGDSPVIRDGSNEYGLVKLEDLEIPPYENEVLKAQIAKRDMSEVEKSVGTLEFASKLATAYKNQDMVDRSVKNKRYFIFQFFPESISDSRNVDWQNTMLVGASHPLYQWIQGSERTISFTAVIYQEIYGKKSGDDSTMFADKYSYDVRAAVNWLRAKTYPSYNNQDRVAVAPPRLKLTIKNHYFAGHNLWGANFSADNSKTKSMGADSMLCIMTGCDVNYTKWWADGTPRKAEVSLTFAEIVQPPGGGSKYWSREYIYVG